MQGALESEFFLLRLLRVSTGNQPMLSALRGPSNYVYLYPDSACSIASRTAFSIFSSS